MVSSILGFLCVHCVFSTDYRLFIIIYVSNVHLYISQDLHETHAVDEHLCFALHYLYLYHCNNTLLKAN